MFIRVIDIPYVPVLKWRMSPVSQLFVVARLADTAGHCSVHNVAVRTDKFGWISVPHRGIICQGLLLPKLRAYVSELDGPVAMVQLTEAISVIEISSPQKMLTSGCGVPGRSMKSPFVGTKTRVFKLKTLNFL